MTFKTISEIGDIKGKRVLLRLDLNVPVQNGVVTDVFRITQALPTVKMLRDLGARTIILAHLEVPDAKDTPTLSPIADVMKKYVPVTFVRELLRMSEESATEKGEAKGEAEIELAEMKDGDVVLLENIRSYPGEKTNDEVFAKKLASLGDIYVNEAFSVSHRAHASLVGIPKFLPSYAGMLFAEEVKTLSMSFHPEKPFLFILGGAKFSTKMPLVTKFLDIADYVYIAGALANDCYKAQGLNVGRSVVSEGDFDIKKIIASPKVLLPTEVVVENLAGEDSVKKPEEVTSDDIILDAGKGAVADLKKIINQCRFILWNGPLGNYEKGYTQATSALARAIAESSAHAIVGGGDTLAAIAALQIEDKFAFVSTAGGAMLDFLAHETLPGIEALEGGVGQSSITLPL